MGELVKYNAACQALAAARRVDEVKLIRDTHIAMKLAAKIAKNKQLAQDADAIVRRAERRVGELMAAQAKAVGKAKGGQPHQKNRKATGLNGNPVAPSLAEAGIDKNLADRACTMASIDEKSFEKVIAAVAATDHFGLSLNGVRETFQCR